jgi:hypothetical protein
LQSQKEWAHRTWFPRGFRKQSIPETQSCTGKGYSIRKIGSFTLWNRTMKIVSSNPSMADCRILTAVMVLASILMEQCKWEPQKSVYRTCPGELTNCCLKHWSHLTATKTFTRDYYFDDLLSWGFSQAELWLRYV